LVIVDSKSPLENFSRSSESQRNNDMSGIGPIEILAVLAVCGTPIVGFFLFIWLMPKEDPEVEKKKLQAIKKQLQCPKCLMRGSIRLDSREISQWNEYRTRSSDDHEINVQIRLIAFQDYCTNCGWRSRKVESTYQAKFGGYSEIEEEWLRNHDDLMKTPPPINKKD